MLYSIGGPQQSYAPIHNFQQNCVPAFFYLLEFVERWVYVEYWLPTTASPPLILGGSDLGSASGLQRGFCLTGSTFLRRPSMLQQPRREDMSFRGGTTLL